MALLATGLAWSTLPPHPRRPPSSSGLARSLNIPAPDDDDRTWRWSVTRAQASQGALVVTADVLDMSESLDIAHQIVEPVQMKYTEVLVYLHQFGANSQFAARRVQWTPGGGYKETALDASP
jgi:hypothetical protein